MSKVTEYRGHQIVHNFDGYWVVERGYCLEITETLECAKELIDGRLAHLTEELDK